ncbi:MAG: DUF3795 domain-containing protein [Bacteroidales bacterium]|nr:DUF3795 domain-containing protein [Bacteroidales bacterium]MBK8882127.1 DUF3795 domain-containing protein [Bacteroidales bacterium]
MEQLIKFTEELIAPCGINCGTCLAYLRDKNRCHGCRHADLNIPKSRMSCRIKNCENLAKTESKLCIDCQKFPCTRMKQLDKRYRTRYHTSLIGNLETIGENGMESFLANEVMKWSCPNCGANLSIHRDTCLKCNHKLKSEFL